METTAPVQFARACGAHAAVDLRIERADGAVLAEGRLDFPFAVFGRAAECEITLNDPHVHPRHTALQVVGGRVLLADLAGSSLGVVGPAGGAGFAWLTPTAPAKIGPYHLYLQQPISVAPDPLDRGFNPFQPAPDLVGRMPRAVVKFLNGRTARGEWPVNRLMTFVGRAPECKISLSAEDIAAFHCYLLLTHTGLWVVDLLSPAGVRVNGEPVRFGRLADGDIVEVGRFRLGCWYPDGEPVVPGTEFPTPAGPTRLRAGDPSNPTARGKGSTTDPSNPTARGKGSTTDPSPLPPKPAPDSKANPPAPILYPQSGVLPVLPDREVPPPPDTLPAGFQRPADIQALLGAAADPGAAGLPFATGPDDTSIPAMWNALQMFGSVPPDRITVAQQQVARLADLNAELQRLHDAVSDAALSPAAPGATPVPGQQAVYDRVKEIQAERAAIWQQLFAIVTGTEPG